MSATSGQCGGCGSSGTTLKYISCLHTLCVPCVQNSIDFDGSIKCPKCFSSTPLPVSVCAEPLRSLPSVVTRGHLGTGTSHVYENQLTWCPVLCEECGDDALATSICENCHVKLCEIHAGSHPLSKMSKGHVVKPIDHAPVSSPTAGSTGSTTAQRSRSCAVHTGEVLEQFCAQCNQILCSRCKLAPSHKQDHHVLDIASAGLMTRDRLAVKLASCTTDVDAVVKNAMRNVSKNIEALNEQTEDASAKVTDFVRQLMETLKKYELNLSAQLDAMRSKKLILLEKQLNRLQECVSQTESAGIILQSFSDDVDLLRICLWIDGTLDKAMKTIEEETEPCTAGGIIFSSADTTGLRNDLDKCGAVLDVAACAVLQCPHRATTQDDTILRVNLGACAASESAAGSADNSATDSPDAALAVTQEQLDSIRLKVAVKRDGEDALCLDTRCESLPARIRIDQGLLQAGCYTVSATVGGSHLQGSPCALSVSTSPLKPLFDATRCGRNLAIQSKGTCVRCCGRQATHTSACTARMGVQSGVNVQKVRIDRTAGGDILLSACSSTTPVLEGYQQNKAQCFGWYGTMSILIHTGSGLGQPWQSGDIIQLTLDHDQHALIGHHERTGAMETIQNVTGDLYWMVTLYDEDDQVTLL